MRNVSQRPKLSFEAIDVRGLGARQRLKRDDFVHPAIVRFVHHAHAARAQTAAQGKAFGAEEFCGGLSHRRNTIAEIDGSTPEALVDRYVIVPYMICAINNQDEENLWTGACC